MLRSDSIGYNRIKKILDLSMNVSLLIGRTRLYCRYAPISPNRDGCIGGYT